MRVASGSVPACFARVMALVLGMQAASFAQENAEPPLLPPDVTLEQVRTAGGEDTGEVEQFVRELRSALHHDSCLEVAAVTHFPFYINQSRVDRRAIWNRTAFCRYFKSVFTPRLKTIVTTSPLSPVGSRGFMFGNGDLWVQRMCAKERPATCKVGLYAFNSPAPSR